MLNLFELRSNHESAITLGRVPREIIFVIFLCTVKGRERFDIGRDGGTFLARGIEFCDECFNFLLLFVGRVKDDGAVLSADVIPLPIDLRRVVRPEKTVRSVSYETCVESYSMRITSACPVSPVQTCSYVGFGVVPPA